MVTSTANIGRHPPDSGALARPCPGKGQRRRVWVCRSRGSVLRGRAAKNQLQVRRHGAQVRACVGQGVLVDPFQVRKQEGAIPVFALPQGGCARTDASGGVVVGEAMMSQGPGLCTAFGSLTQDFWCSKMPSYLLTYTCSDLKHGPGYAPICFCIAVLIKVNLVPVWYAKVR